MKVHIVIKAQAGRKVQISANDTMNHYKEMTYDDPMVSFTIDDTICGNILENLEISVMSSDEKESNRFYIREIEEE